MPIIVANPIVPPQFNTPIDNVLVATFVITPAQFQAMTTNGGGSPIQLLPPLTGTLSLVGGTYDLLWYSINMQFPPVGGVAYATGTGNLDLISGTGFALVSGGNAFTAINVTQTSSIYSSGPGSTAAGGTIATNLNGGILLALASGASYTAGNSPFVITLRYRINQLA